MNSNISKSYLKYFDSLKDAQFEKMVEYLIEEPTEKDSNSRQFRFPFMSCELLTCQVPVIFEQFFERQPVLEEEVPP